MGWHCSLLPASPLVANLDVVGSTPTSTDGAQVLWQEVEATGSAPASMWHHQCAAFRQGTRAVVFGGDTRPSDPEFAFLEDRAAASHVYVLDVTARMWERVTCTAPPGAQPSWRSLHVGLACRGPGSVGSEELLILGGTDEHTRPFSSGDPADFQPYLLDLDRYTWRTSLDTAATATNGDASSLTESVPFTPTPRMRFAAEAYGGHVLVYSGHGPERLPPSERVLRLDLATLTWHRMPVRNHPVSLPDTPAACLAGGVLVAGVQMSPFFGITPCPKFDLLCLVEPPAEGSSASASGEEALDSQPEEATWEGSPLRQGQEVCCRATPIVLMMRVVLSLVSRRRGELATRPC